MCQEVKANHLSVVCISGKWEATQQPVRGEQVPKLRSDAVGARTAVQTRELWLLASTWMNLRHNIGGTARCRIPTLGTIDVNS